MTVLKLATPVIAANLTQTFINLLDTIFIGFLPKEYSIAGQAALMPAITLHWLIGGFVGAISVGTQAMTARRFGEGSKEGAGKVLFNSAWIALLVGTAVSLAAMYFAEPLFRLFNAKEAVVAQGVPYVQARFSAILAMVGTLSFKSFFDGLGKTHYHLIVAIIMNVFNAALNYLLVFGAFGFPQMYVLGAGVGSSIASYVGLFIIVGWALIHKYRKGFGIFRWSNLDFSVMSKIVRLSLPSGLATVIVMTGFMLFYKWVGQIESLPGQSEVPVYEAATTVIIQIMSIAFMSTMGLGVATATLVSQNLGRGLPDEAEKHAWISVRLGMVLTGLLGLFALAMPDTFMGLFTHDQEVVEAGRTSLMMLGAIESLLGVGMVLAQALFGAGNTKFVMYVEVFLHLTCLVPLSYLLGIVLDFGLEGIWAGAVVYVAALAVIMVLKFRTGTWKKIEI